MSSEKAKTDQYQLRLAHEFRKQLEEQARKDGDTSRNMDKTRFA